MPVLELKVPPPVVAFVTAALMWLVSWTIPAFAFVFPARNLFAIGLAAARRYRHFRRRDIPARPNHRQPNEASIILFVGDLGHLYNYPQPDVFGWSSDLDRLGNFLSNALAFLFLPTYILYINRFQIAPEEKALTSLFGQEFVAYNSRVRRSL